MYVNDIQLIFQKISAVKVVGRRRADIWLAVRCAHAASAAEVHRLCNNLLSA